MTECPSCQAVLPQPPERFCPNCGADLGLPADVMPYAAPPAGGYPAPGYPPGGYGSAPAGGGTPWDRRAQIGFLNALIETTKEVLTQPAAFFRGMSVTGGIGGPLLYAVIVGLVGLIASAIYSSVFRGVLSDSIARMGGGTDLARLAPFLQGGSLVATVLLGPVIIAMRVFIGSGLIHLALLAMGAAQRGYEATFRVTAYSHAPSIFSIIPVCGGLVEAVYTLVLLIIGVSESHAISRGKAAVAVLVPGLVLCCCCLGVILLFAFGLAGMIGRMR